VPAGGPECLGAAADAERVPLDLVQQRGRENDILAAKRRPLVEDDLGLPPHRRLERHHLTAKDVALPHSVSQLGEQLTGTRLLQRHCLDLQTSTRPVLLASPHEEDRRSAGVA
jgi:hypothetical protein